MKTLKRSIAAVIATTIMTASATSISANAVNIPGISSNFEYELSVTQISNSEVILKFFTTNNPGVSELSLALVYDPNRFDAVKCVPDHELSSNIIKASGNNLTTGVFFVGCIMGDGSFTNDRNDYTENFELSFYLKADDGDVTDEDISQFAVAVVQYSSKNENINNYSRLDDSGHYDPEIVPPEAVVDRLNYQYILGDTNDSGRNANGTIDALNAINITDATNINTLISYANMCNLIPSVNTLNQKISNNVTTTLSNGSTFAWGNVFNHFIRNVSDVTFSCVESADANKDNYITIEDSNLVLNWYSQIGSGIPANDLIEIADKIIYF